jgi:SAM-dependent methyltransferase
MKKGGSGSRNGRGAARPSGSGRPSGRERDSRHGPAPERGDARARGFRALQRGLTGDRSLIGVSYMDSPELLRAYLDFYWPISFEQTRRALAVSSLLSGAPARVSRVIDAGSGPGPVAAAFASAGATALTLLDQSPRALDLARETIASRSGNSEDRSSPPIETVVCDIANPDPARVPLWGAADIVSFGHSLNEVASGRDDRVAVRAALLERYATALSPGGSILVIEPALLSTSRDLLALRNLLVSRGWRVLAPCVDRARLDCPALAAGESQTCHDEVRWTMPASVERLAQSLALDKESLKMTWFLFAPPGTDASLDETEAAREASGATGDAAARDAAVDDSAKGAPTLRVVSDAMLNKAGRARRLLCGERGRFPLSAVAGSADARDSGFDALERGSFVRVRDPEARENGWGVAPGTAIETIPIRG